MAAMPEEQNKDSCLILNIISSTTARMYEEFPFYLINCLCNGHMFHLLSVI